MTSKLKTRYSCYYRNHSDIVVVGYFNQSPKALLNDQTKYATFGCLEISIIVPTAYVIQLSLSTFKNLPHKYTCALVK